MAEKVVGIIDCFTDEPVGLGVPPYMSTIVRYVAGACRVKNVKTIYLTIDDFRHHYLPKKNSYEYDKRVLNKTRYAQHLDKTLEQIDIFVCIAGVHTPGKYISAEVGTVSEILSFLSKTSRPCILGGPSGIFINDSTNVNIVTKDLCAAVFDFLQEGIINDRWAGWDEKNLYSVAGAPIILEHPSMPFTICDIDTYTGCVRYITGGCSFCAEAALHGKPQFRNQEDIVAEIKALYAAGISHFRLGGQSCFYSYKAKNLGETEFVKPQPKEIETLLSNITQACPHIKVLHIDNVNPAIIAHHPKESKKITKSIVKYCTAGNVAAFGLESCDPEVKKKNNLNSSPEEVYEASKLINTYGRKQGNNGMPLFLPGINIIFGLPGETKNTFELNFSFLKKLLDDDIWVRRINIRRLMLLPNMTYEKEAKKISKKHHSLIMKYREKIRSEIDFEFLKRIFPVETELKNLITEINKGNLTFARQIGSYPLVCATQGKMAPKTIFNAKVIGWSNRSLTVIPYPFPINTASLDQIAAIPGIGKKRAARLVRHRPFSSLDQLDKILDDKNIITKVKSLIGTLNDTTYQCCKAR